MSNSAAKILGDMSLLLGQLFEQKSQFEYIESFVNLELTGTFVTDLEHNFSMLIVTFNQTSCMCKVHRFLGSVSNAY